MSKSQITCPERTREQEYHMCTLAKYKEKPVPIRLYARIIYEDWLTLTLYARPYVAAMATLDSIDGHYYQDTAKEIVLRFLCNAASWRGEVARETKKQLKQLCGVK